MIPLDARNWNTGIITLVFVGLLVWPLLQGLMDWWGDRHRRRAKRRQERADTPPVQPGS